MNYTLAEGKAFHRLGLELAKQSPWFEKINRRYRNVEGYEPFSLVAKQFAYNLFALEMGLVERQLTVNDFLADFAWSAVVLSGWMLAHHPFPVWWLHQDLFEAFEESDLPKAIADLQVSVPFGVIMLPHHRILNPDREHCDWVFFQYLPQGFVFPTMHFGSHRIAATPVDCDKLRWTTVLRNGTGYASTVELAGEQLIHGEFEISKAYFDTNVDLTLEQQFQHRIEKIVLQTLLYLQIRPDDLMAPTAALTLSTKAQGFGGKQSTDTRLIPLIIGQQFQPQIERIGSSSTHLAHASPRTHWRRGHWRRVALGEGRQKREWRWIQPILVNG